MKLANRISIVRRGTTIINRHEVPVLEIDGEEVVQRQDAVSGLPEVISLRGAKRFKSQPYAFHPSIEGVVVENIFAKPFALLDPKEQEERTERVLEALLNRVLESGAAFRFMEN